MLVIDTGVLVSIADTTDPHHDACAVLLQNETEQLVTTAMVIAETAYLLDRDLGPRAEALLYQMILDGDLHVDVINIADWQRIHQLVMTYADLRLGGTDASLIALAERHRQQRIATLNMVPTGARGSCFWLMSLRCAVTRELPCKAKEPGQVRAGVVLERRHRPPRRQIGHTLPSNNRRWRPSSMGVRGGLDAASQPHASRSDKLWSKSCCSESRAGRRLV